MAGFELLKCSYPWEVEKFPMFLVYCHLQVRIFQIYSVSFQKEAFFIIKLPS